MTSSQGRIIEVSEQLLGSPLAADVAAAATSITVIDFADFNDSGGGTLQLYNPTTGTTETIAYSSGDDDTGVIQLSAATVNTYDTDSFVAVYPLAYEKVAQVVIDGEDDALAARVPHSLYDLLADGVRESTAQESVTVQVDRAGEWFVTDVVGKLPIQSGAYLDPTTIPDPVPIEPPAVSPAITTHGMPSSILLRAEAVEPATSIEYHASLTSGFTPGPTTLLPNTPTKATVYVATSMPDGNAIPASTQVYFRTIATNAAGSAAASAEVVGLLNQDAIAELFAQILIAGAVEAKHIQFGTGYLDADEGLVLPQPGGDTTRLTNDGVTPSTLAGFALLVGATVRDNLNLYGLSQLFGTMKMANGVSDPLVKAGMSRTWDGLVVPDLAGGFPDTAHGIVTSVTDSTKWVVAGALFGGSTQIFNKSDGVQPGATNVSLGSTFNPTGGITAVGSNYYALGYDTARANAWYVYKLDTARAKVAEFFVASSFSSVPGIGTDGTNVLVAYTGSAGALKVRTYTTGGSLSSDDTLLSSGSIPAGQEEVGGVYKGTADFGATRIIVAMQTGSIYAFTTAFARVITHEWGRAFSKRLRGLEWDGTQFQQLDNQGKIWHFEVGHVSTSTQYGGYTWYDGDTSSGSSVHETKVSPFQSFSWPARSRLVITGQAAPDVGDTDSTHRDKANLVRIYTGTTSGTMRLQNGGGTNSALPLGVTELPIVGAPDTGSALAPTSTSFGATSAAPGTFQSAALDGTSTPITQLKGDGAARITKLVQGGAWSTGTFSVNGSGGEKTQAVTFDPAFDAIPNVFANAQVNEDNVTVWADTVTTSGCTLHAYRPTGAGTAGMTVVWNALARTQ